jgi:hypothetical protein
MNSNIYTPKWRKCPSFFTLLFSLLSYIATAQMPVGIDTLYGNEWINYTQTYYKIAIANDGVYRLTQADLQTAGVPTSSVQAANFRIYRMGNEIPVYTSTNANLTAADYLEFYARFLHVPKRKCRHDQPQLQPNHRYRYLLPDLEQYRIHTPFRPYTQ